MDTRFQNKLRLSFEWKDHFLQNEPGFTSVHLDYKILPRREKRGHKTDGLENSQVKWTATSNCGCSISWECVTLFPAHYKQMPCE